VNQWIYVVCYQNSTAAAPAFEVLRAYRSEKRAQEIVALLTATPFERHSLTTGHYLYHKIPLA
jgi:hypothetical protein